MKMRNLVTALFIIAAVAVQAQSKWGASSADSVKCWENYNNFGSLMQTKSYVAAYEHWNYVYTNCPGVKKNTFIYAPRILKAMIKDASTPEEKDKYADQLIGSYDKRLQYFPGKEAYVTGEKALQIWKYKKDHEEAYAVFEEAYTINRAEMTPAQINGYFLSAVKMKNAKLIELDELIRVYIRMNETVADNRILLTNQINELKAKEEANGSLDKKDAKNLKKAETSFKAYTTVEKNIEKAISPVLSCNNLALIINEENFQANYDNKKWLGRAAKMLQKERMSEDGELDDCTDNPMFTKIAERMLELEPSAGGYRAIARKFFKEKNYTKSSEYYSKAIELEQDPEQKGKDLLGLAESYRKMGKFASAKRACLDAAKTKTDWGQPYLVLAQVYGSADGQCGKDVVEKKAVYWAAINMCAKAKSIEPALATKANNLINAYKKGVPDKSIAFNLGYVEGNKITLGCWINETVTVKFYK
ncbi:MAG: hypothetical protein N4A46_13520 [Schleiferiaceae bacterium]|nr:hypothetical protein [Schleiferiaceae bacterium]